MINKGANINEKNNSGMSPLHIATKRGQVDIVQILLSNNVDVNAVDLQNKTALWYAINNQDDACFMRLLETGADFEKPGFS